VLPLFAALWPEGNLKHYMTTHNPMQRSSAKIDIRNDKVAAPARYAAEEPVYVDRKKFVKAVREMIPSVPKDSRIRFNFESEVTLGGGALAAAMGNATDHAVQKFHELEEHARHNRNSVANKHAVSITCDLDKYLAKAYPLFELELEFRKMNKVISAVMMSQRWVRRALHRKLADVEKSEEAHAMRVLDEAQKVIAHSPQLEFKYRALQNAPISMSPGAALVGRTLGGGTISKEYAAKLSASASVPSLTEDKDGNMYAGLNFTPRSRQKLQEAKKRDQRISHEMISMLNLSESGRELVLAP